MPGKELLAIGKISGVFGIRGWVKVFSYTDPRENILAYNPWILRKGNEQRQVELLAGKLHGKSVIAEIQGIEDCNQAALLNGWNILIDKDQLPDTDKDEYYWTDLVGLTVRNTHGVEFGKVDYLIETGANDVLVIKGDKERLVPFIQRQTVLNIDLENGLMVVDWDADF